MNRWMKPVLGAVAAVALADAAMAVVVRVRDLEVPLPRVNANGNLGPWTGEGIAKFSYNDNTGRLHIVARGDVENRSDRRQVYEDVLLTGFVDGKIIKDDYTVTARGKATYNGLARNVNLESTFN